MDPQFDTNMTTFYLIIPLLVIGLATLVWFVMKIKTTVWKRVTLSIVSLFAFFGFFTGVLAVYYHFNEPFAAMFKFYAYSKLAPDDDPFVQANDSGRIIRVLGMTEVTKKDGQVVLPDFSSHFDFDYAGHVFTHGKWQTVKVKDHVMSVQDSDNNGQPDIITTSLWWALTNDPYKLTVSVEE
jgi:hypothetical protein